MKSFLRIFLDLLHKQFVSSSNVIVKLDIEGGEIEALRNLPRDILQRITCLSMELHSISSLHENTQILEMLNHLKLSGFRSIYISK